MKKITTLLMLLAGVVSAHALVVSEIMSNPTGDDSGREWVEVFNDTTSDIDLSAMTVSIKGGSFVTATPLQGGTKLVPGDYAIIASTVSGGTKFLQDYPMYSGMLFRAGISLVNTGTTSIDIKVNGAVAASVPAYTAAKEGQTLSLLGGSYVPGTPTPGTDNQAIESSSSGSTTSTTTENQVTVPQMTPPSPDITIYIPEEKVVVAGAPTEFSAYGLTRAGKPINDLHFSWAFGDGGQGTGSSTLYRYTYSGRYIAQVEATSPTIAGKGRIMVRVVPPDIAITSFGTGKYGSYVDISNPNTYELELSQWTLTIDGAGFPFPRNTVLPANSTTRFSGLAMGFASTTIATSSVIKILFPNLEEVTRFTSSQPELVLVGQSTTTPLRKVIYSQPKVLGVATTTKPTVVPTSTLQTTKDRRIVAWIKSLFK